MSTISTGSILQEDVTQYYLQFMSFLLQQKRILIGIGLRYDLTPMQTIALLLLDVPLPMGSLTTAFGCDASNVTGIIDGLQHKELVRRYESPNDRRVRMIELSENGKKLRETLLNQLIDEADPNPIFSKLDADEQKVFFRLVDKVTR